MPVSSPIPARVAMVTGASSGIGEAIVGALVARGTHVAMAARRFERQAALAERLQAPGAGETLVVPCDVRQPGDVRRLVSETLARWGTLDVLIANAGLGYRAPIVEGDITRWKTLLDTNVYGLLLTLRYGVPPLLERHAGHVIVLSSVAGRVFTPLGGAYCASKAAATAVAEVLRQEVAAQGVRVTAIEPGVVASEFQQVAGYTPQIMQGMPKGATPLAPDDIARAVLYALDQPANVGVGELVIRPTGQGHP